MALLQEGFHFPRDGMGAVNHVPPIAPQGRMHVAAPGVPRRLSFTQPTSVLPGLAAPGSDIIEFYARMPVRGLHLAGQTKFPGYGVPSAMLSGVQAADALVRQLQAGRP